jgi:hypothetical protein
LIDVSIRETIKSGLGESIMADIDELYTALTRTRRKTTKEAPIDERRVYLAEAAKRYRQRQRTAKERGSPEPTSPNVRSALADAALMLLATDGPGADQIRNYLARVFVGRAGVPGTVTAKAKSGRLKPKLLKLS